jgi:DNA polymerase
MEQPTKKERLAALERKIKRCKQCKLRQGCKQTVFGVGNQDTDLVFVGEAPGADEDREGIPFVGRAGQLLTKIIEAMGLARDSIYICNVIKCRPPENRDPEPDEIAECEPYLLEQLDVIQPRVMVGLGRIAVQTLFKNKIPITKTRGKWLDYHGIPFMPTYHPAYLLRYPAGKADVWTDMQEVMRVLGMKPPKKGK